MENLQCPRSGKVGFVGSRFVPHSSVNKLIRRPGILLVLCACCVIFTEFLCNVLCSRITWHLTKLSNIHIFWRVGFLMFAIFAKCMPWHEKISGFARKIWAFRVMTVVWLFQHMRNLQIMGVIADVASFQRKQLFCIKKKRRLLSNYTKIKFLSIVFHLQALEDLQCCWSGKVVFVRFRFVPHSSVNKLIKRSVRELPFYGSDWLLCHRPEFLHSTLCTCTSFFLLLKVGHVVLDAFVECTSWHVSALE